MYTATLEKTEVRKAEGRIDAYVSISNGTDVVTKLFTVGLRSEDVVGAIKQQVKHFIESLENADTKVAAVSAGVMDLTSVPTTVATKEENDRNKWLVKYNKLIGAQKLIDLGIIDNTQTQYVNLRDTVIADFKPAYVNYV